MMYGLLFSIVLACVNGAHFRVDMTVAYLGSLFFLAVVGTLLAFGAYLELLKTVGPARAAYCTVWAPIGALAISAHFEAFNWTVLAGLAIALIAGGNVLVLSPAADQKPHPADIVEVDRIAAP